MEEHKFRNIVIKRIKRHLIRSGKFKRGRTKPVLAIQPLNSKK